MQKNGFYWLHRMVLYGNFCFLFFVFCCFLDQIYMKRFFSCFEWNHFFRRHRRLYFNKLQLQYVKNAHIANILIIKDQTAFTSHWERKKTELSKNLHTIQTTCIHHHCGKKSIRTKTDKRALSGIVRQVPVYVRVLLYFSSFIITTEILCRIVVYLIWMRKLTNFPKYRTPKWKKTEWNV